MTGIRQTDFVETDRRKTDKIRETGMHVNRQGGRQLERQIYE